VRTYSKSKISYQDIISITGATHTNMVPENDNDDSVNDTGKDSNDTNWQDLLPEIINDDENKIENNHEESTSMLPPSSPTTIVVEYEVVPAVSHDSVNNTIKYSDIDWQDFVTYWLNDDAVQIDSKHGQSSSMLPIPPSPMMMMMHVEEEVSVPVVSHPRGRSSRVLDSRDNNSWNKKVVGCVMNRTQVAVFKVFIPFIICITSIAPLG